MLFTAGTCGEKSAGRLRTFQISVSNVHDTRKGKQALPSSRRCLSSLHVAGRSQTRGPFDRHEVAQVPKIVGRWDVTTPADLS